MAIFELHLAHNSKKLDDYLLASFDDGSHPDMQRYLYRMLVDYTKNAGKRHRPLICMLACEAVGGDPNKARSAASAIEHFHTAALIHDDIADESETRRGAPCMHLAEGIGLAINAGDLALSLVTGTVLRDPDLDDSTKLRVLGELVDMTTRTIEGQALDIGWARDARFDLTVDDYLLMATHKTAFYSGAVPLAVGAIIGGGSEDEINALREFGMATGLAFQIQDDVLNVVGDKEATKKDFCSDITEGKRTLMAVYTLENSPQANRFLEILAAHTTDLGELAEAVEIMQECGAVEHAQQYATNLIVGAKEDLQEALPPSKPRDLLASMAEFFVDRMN